MARVVVAHPERDRMTRGDRIGLDDQLGDIARLLGELLGPLGLSLVVGQEISVLLHGGVRTRRY